MKGIGLIVSCLLSCAAWGVPTVSDLTVTPVAPWGLVLDYTVSGADEAETDAGLIVTATADGTNYTARHLSGATNWTNGSHRVYWNMAKDGITATVADSVVQVEYAAPYCVVDLSGGTSAASYPISYLSAVPAGGWMDEYKTTKLVLRRVEAGTFIMGDDRTDETHRVTLTKPFYMGVFEVTQKQWELVMGNNPSSYMVDMRPVERVSYDDIRGSSDGAQWPSSSAVDATSFLGRLRAKTGLEDFDLPTEAQWEYACRAGTTSTYNNGGDTEDDLKTLGRYSGNSSDGRGTTVGSYAPNAWGLYDMHGNEWEWCLNWYDWLSYGTDPVGSSSGSSRVIRGGSWSSSASSCSSSCRTLNDPSGLSGGGFRLVRTLNNKAECVGVGGGPVVAGSASVSHVAWRAHGERELVVGPLQIGYVPDGNGRAVVRIDGQTVVDSATSGTYMWRPQTTGRYSVVHSGWDGAFTATYTAMRDDRSSLYCVVDLSGGTSATSYPVSSLSAVPAGGWTDEHKTTKLVLRRIEAGSFIMGGGITSESHRVTLTKPFYVGVFEVTQRQWELVMGSNPSYYTGDVRPVEYVSYYDIRGLSDGARWPASSAVDATSFLGKLRAKTGLDGFDLPTEAQWEYACRAGTTSTYNNDGGTEDDLKTLGRYCDNRSDGRGGYTDAHTAVGSYVPNAWGLYDMHGNVWEWCLDWYGSLSYGTDPEGSSSGSSRVLRGGGWSHYASSCTSSYRSDRNPSFFINSYGFRLVCPISIKGDSVPDDSDTDDDTPSGVGNLTFTPGDVTVTEWSGAYDGMEHGVSVSVDSGIAGAAVAYATAQDGPYSSVPPTRTDAGSQTTWYVVTAPGYVPSTNTATVSILPRTVTLTSVSASKEYDGTALVKHEVSVGGAGFVLGEGATYTFTGSQTAVGTSDNTFTYGLNANTKASNYDIVVNYGTLTVIDGTWNFAVATDGTVSITGVSSATGDIVIPDKIGGRPVTSIGRSAFKGCSGLTSVTIPDGVTSIGWSAFEGCSGLTCVTIPSSVTNIGSEVFKGCSGLTSVTIPDGVTSIGWSAFEGCSGLTCVTIPSSVTNIGNSVFSGCTAIRHVEWNSSLMPNISGCFASSISNLTNVVLGSAVSCIGGGAFGGCSGLTCVTIPDGVTSIGRWAFSGCSGLTSVTIPSSVTNIGNYAFINCPSLKTIRFMGNAPTIGSGCFPSDVVLYVQDDAVGWEVDSSGKWFGFRIYGKDVIGGGTEDFGYSGDNGNGDSVAHEMAMSAIWGLPRVSNLKVTSRSPWGLVLDYTVSGAMGMGVEMVALVTATAGGRTYTARNLFGATNCSNGAHRVYWDMQKDGITAAVTNSVVRVAYSNYCVVDLSNGASATYYPVSYRTSALAWSSEYKTTKLLLRLVPAGTFIMGKDQSDESHRVTISRPFYMGVFEVTQKQWELVMGSNPSQYKGNTRPVERVSYDDIRGSSLGCDWPASFAVDATSFLGRLRARTGLNGFDLPTDAQWECACRAGTMSLYNNGGDTEDDLKTLARYSGNTSDGCGGYESFHTAVGSYASNAWGLYDMHGNVSEWCLDWHVGSSLLSYGVDPVGRATGSSRVLRGGNWYYGAVSSSYRISGFPDGASYADTIGFRLAMNVKSKTE